MRIQKKTHELIRQNEKIVKKPQKHDANLQKNSTFYFQVGLIVCLLAAFGLLEMKFETTMQPDIVLKIPDDPTLVSIENFRVYEEPKKEIKPEPVKKVILTVIPKIVHNNYDLEKGIEIITGDQNTSSDKPVDPTSVVVLKKPEETYVHIGFVEKAPIYPGCEKAKNNDERKKCMSEKIAKLIQKRFDGNTIASENGLFGRQKIDVQFKIDKTGKVTNIESKANHPKLENEAERVISFIPVMTPGKQQDKNVGVIYTLPIVFQVE